jgi:hypothetical protein
MREGQGMAGLPKKGGYSKSLNWLKICMYLLLLLLPTTKRTRVSETATVLFRPRVCKGVGGINGVVW